MEKKRYITPQVEMMLVDMITMIAASASDIPVTDENGGGDALSNDRRGGWGNLWDKN